MDGKSSKTTSIVDSDEELMTKAQNIIATKSENEPLPVDLKNKMAIICNVLKSCMEEMKTNEFYSKAHVLYRLAYLTKLQTPLLFECLHNTQELETTDYLEDSILETPDLDLLIRRTLLSYYVNNNKIPKSESLNYTGLNHRFKYQTEQQLRRSGYVRRRLPNTKNTVILEHPKRIIERQRYLHAIMNYRKNKRCIVYIETKTYTKADKDICHFLNYLAEGVEFIIVLIAVANNNLGFIKADIIASTSIYECQKLIEDYLIKEILPNLNEPSVIILENKSFYRKSLPVPTIESEKSEMVKWLQINGLLHDKNVHRCELFDLIQRCKNKRDLHNFDAVVNSYGHEILRRPSRTEYLNYYEALWGYRFLNENVTVKISKRTWKYWNKLEVSLIDKEISVFNADNEMENITDKIFTMANNTNVKEWAEVECDVGHDSLAQEEFIKVINNTFSQEELKIREEQLLLQIKTFQLILKQKPEY